MTTDELRNTRIERGLSLTEVSARTRIGVLYLERIEEGRFRELPGGFYARAFVRAYAEATGANVEDALELLTRELPPSDEVLPGAIEAANTRAATSSVVTDARTEVVRRLLTRHDAEAGEATRAAARTVPRRLLAASVDGAVLAAVHLGVLGVTALYCGVALGELVQAAGIAVFTVLALITAAYVLLMGGIAGQTIGAMLLDVPLVAAPREPLDLSAIARRSVDCVRADLAAAAEVKALVAGLLDRRRPA